MNIAPGGNTKPRKVKIAVILLIIAIVIYTISTAVFYYNMYALGGWLLQYLMPVIIIFAIVLFVAPIFFSSVIVHLIIIRKSWARVMLAVIIVIELFHIITTDMKTDVGQLSGLLLLIHFVPNAVALVLLFSKESNEWFRGVKNLPVQ